MDTAHAQTRRFATSSHAHFQEHDLSTENILEVSSLCYSDFVRDLSRSKSFEQYSMDPLRSVR